jgi:hypothetical protein
LPFGDYSLPFGDYSLPFGDYSLPFGDYSLPFFSCFSGDSPLLVPCAEKCVLADSVARFTSHTTHSHSHTTHGRTTHSHTTHGRRPKFQRPSQRGLPEVLLSSTGGKGALGLLPRRTSFHSGGVGGSSRGGLARPGMPQQSWALPRKSLPRRSVPRVERSVNAYSCLLLSAMVTRSLDQPPAPFRFSRVGSLANC